MTARRVSVSVKETEGKNTAVTVTPTDVKIKIARGDSDAIDEITEEIKDLVEFIPNHVIRTLRGDFRYDDGLLRLTSGGNSYGYHFYDGAPTSIKHKGVLIYGTGWRYDTPA
jgi:hypothetical protein